jgi:hypothetical protein
MGAKHDKLCRWRNAKKDDLCMWRSAKHDKLCMWRRAKHDKLCMWRRAKRDNKLSSPRGPYADGMTNKPIDIHETVLYDNKRGEVNLQVCFLGICTIICPRHEFIAHTE